MDVSTFNGYIGRDRRDKEANTDHPGVVVMKHDYTGALKVISAKRRYN